MGGHRCGSPGKPAASVQQPLHPAHFLMSCDGGGRPGRCGPFCQSSHPPTNSRNASPRALAPRQFAVAVVLSEGRSSLTCLMCRRRGVSLEIATSCRPSRWSFGADETANATCRFWWTTFIDMNQIARPGRWQLGLSCTTKATQYVWTQWVSFSLTMAFCCACRLGSGPALVQRSMVLPLPGRLTPEAQPFAHTPWSSWPQHGQVNSTQVFESKVGGVN